MNLKELVNQVDTQRADVRNEVLALIEQAGEFLYQASYRGRSNFIHTHDGYFATQDIFAAKPFNWLSMDMWPNVEEDKMRTSFMITLSQAQVDALLLSTFYGHKMGGVRKYGLMYWWRFQPREDGWVELLVEVK